MTVPVHRLATTEQFLAVLDGHEQVFAPGERFSYCNGAFVVLALLAERASGVSYHDLVRQRVLAPAGMTATDFLRTDDLPGDVAVGYVVVDGEVRTNALHLPVLATGDGGAYATVGNLHRFWTALDEGRIVSHETVATMTTPVSDVPEEGLRYGLGFWLDPAGDGLQLVGADAGVSFRSGHSPSTGTTWTVVANTSDGAWPVAETVVAALLTAGDARSPARRPSVTRSGARPCRTPPRRRPLPWCGARPRRRGPAARRPCRGSAGSRPC